MGRLSLLSHLSQSPFGRAGEGEGWDKEDLDLNGDRHQQKPLSNSLLHGDQTIAGHLRDANMMGMTASASNMAEFRIRGRDGHVGILEIGGGGGFNRENESIWTMMGPEGRRHWRLSRQTGDARQKISTTRCSVLFRDSGSKAEGESFRVCKLEGRNAESDGAAAIKSRRLGKASLG